MTAILSRIRMRLAAVPLPRLRRLLLALYLLTAFADAAGKGISDRVKSPAS